MEEESGLLPAKIILEEAMKGADVFEEVMVLVQGKDGSIGLISNLETFAERLALLERIKAQMIYQDAVMAAQQDTPTGGA